MLKKIFVFAFTVLFLVGCVGCSHTTVEPMTPTSILVTSDSTYDDTTKGDITALTTHTPTSNNSPTESDDIAALIDKNLDILTADRNISSSERDMIAAHPDEFAQIVALGEQALPYLDEIVKSSDYSEQFYMRKQWQGTLNIS